MPLRFPGQIFDAESGWHDNHHRSYDPNLGRYLQSDPLGLAAGIDTYGYVRGNPVSWVDTDGTNPAAGALVGGAIGGPAGAVAGAAIGLAIGVAAGEILFNAPPKDAPPLPGEIVGDNPRQSSGKRINTDKPAGDFPGIVDGLTGGNTKADDKGRAVCPNGVQIRPGKPGQGPRIDIPENETKPPETIHFPPGTKWLW